MQTSMMCELFFFEGAASTWSLGCAAVSLACAQLMAAGSFAGGGNPSTFQTSTGKLVTQACGTATSQLSLL